MCFLRSGPAIETRAALNDERYHGRDVGRRVINLVNFVRNRNNLLRAIYRRPATIKGRRTGGGRLAATRRDTMPGETGLSVHWISGRTGRGIGKRFRKEGEG